MARLLLSVLLMIALAQHANADAIVVTKAMKASTICEIFVEREGVRVELEIGLGDLDKFENLMPNELFNEESRPDAPFEERFRKFYTEDLVFTGDDRPLVPRLRQIQPGQRVVRDEVTGEPLPPGDDPERVLVVELFYAWEEPPKVLTMRSAGQLDQATGGSIGFVTYHQGLPVNEFRYLSPQQTVDLDWEDPWYSKFRNRNLHRKFNAPINAFLYIENFEVRVEVIVRPRDLQQWIDLGLEGRDTIPAEMQAELKTKAGAFLEEHVQLTVDGKQASPVLDRVEFLRRSLRASTIIDPPEDLELMSATLGIIFVLPTTGLPGEASLEWDLFSPKLPEVRAAATDEAGSMPSLLKPDDKVLVWKNFLKNPTIPKLIEIVPPSRKAGFSLPAVSALCLLALAPVGLGAMRKRRPAFLAAGAVLVAVAIVGWPHARIPLSKRVAVSDEEAREMMGTLLRNVYFSFDFQDEGDRYDILARSASGDVLTEIYLQVRKSLEIQQLGGVRVKVKEVELVGFDLEDSPGETGFAATCKWNARGSVGHWGHIHQRTNQYQARIVVKPVEGEWKIVDLVLLEKERSS